MLAVSAVETSCCWLPTVQAIGSISHRAQTDTSKHCTQRPPASSTARWIGFRLDMLVGLLMTAAPLLMMAVHDSVSRGGLVIPHEAVDAAVHPSCPCLPGDGSRAVGPRMPRAQPLAAPVRRALA